MKLPILPCAEKLELVLSTAPERDTAVTSAVTNFRCHKLTANVNKYNKSELKNVICNQYGEKFAILNTENI